MCYAAPPLRVRRSPRRLSAHEDGPLRFIPGPQDRTFHARGARRFRRDRVARQRRQRPHGHAPCRPKTEPSAGGGEYCVRRRHARRNPNSRRRPAHRFARGLPNLRRLRQDRLRDFGGCFSRGAFCVWRRGRHSSPSITSKPRKRGKNFTQNSYNGVKKSLPSESLGTWKNYGAKISSAARFPATEPMSDVGETQPQRRPRREFRRVAHGRRRRPSQRRAIGQSRLRISCRRSRHHAQDRRGGIGRRRQHRRASLLPRPAGLRAPLAEMFGGGGRGAGDLPDRRARRLCAGARGARVACQAAWRPEQRRLPRPHAGRRHRARGPSL